MTACVSGDSAPECLFPYRGERARSPEIATRNTRDTLTTFSGLSRASDPISS